MDRDELLAFAKWLLAGEFGEGREEEIVDKYLADRNIIGEGMKHMTDLEKLALIRERVDFWRHFGATNAGVQALCEAVTAILNGDDLSGRTTMDASEKSCPQCGRGPMELRRRGARPVREILECASCGWPSRVYC